MEKRLHPRLNTGLNMKYQLGSLESDEVWVGEGTLRNISPAGVYFTCDEHLPLEPGYIRNFTINSLKLCQRMNQASCFMATGLLVRVEEPAIDRATWGIAVKFLTPCGFLNLRRLQPAPFVLDYGHG